MASDTGAELTLRVLVGMARGLDLTVRRLGGYRMNLATLLAVLVVADARVSAHSRAAATTTIIPSTATSSAVCPLGYSR